MSNENIKLMQGNEACAEGAIAAGCRFFGGYPITPSTEIAEILAKRLPQVGGVFIQMEDEIAAMGAVIGASIGGVKSLTATSGPGFSLKQENLGFAMFTEIPCVVVNVMRAGPSTGSPTSCAQADVQQARWGTHGDHPAIVLCPASVKDMYTLTIRAFNIAEQLRTPVILLSDEIISHMREPVDVSEFVGLPIVNRAKPNVPPDKYVPYRPDPETGVPRLANFGEGYRYHITGLTHDETGFSTFDPQKTSALQHRLNDKVEMHRAELFDTREYYMEDADVAVLAYGCTSRSAMSAVRDAREKGVRAGLIVPITMWPFPDELIHDVASRVKAIIVPEMNLGQVAREVERAACGQTEVIPLSVVTWELPAPAMILEEIERVAKWGTSNVSSVKKNSRISGVPVAVME